jgi:hypothetical protein
VQLVQLNWRIVQCGTALILLVIRSAQADLLPHAHAQQINQEAQRVFDQIRAVQQSRREAIPRKRYLQIAPPLVRSTGDAPRRVVPDDTRAPGRTESLEDAGIDLAQSLWADYRIDQYVAPLGIGYVMTVIIEIDGKEWWRQKRVGPGLSLPGGADDWYVHWGPSWDPVNQ